MRVELKQAALIAPMIMLILIGSAAGQVGVEVWMEATPEKGNVKIIAYARSDKPEQLRYELTSEKTGQPGRSTTRQAAPLKVECCDPTVLSRLVLSVQPGDRYAISLRLYKGDVLLAEKILLYPN